MKLSRKKRVQALRGRSKSLQRRVRHLEEENRALRVAVGLDAAQIEEIHMVGRVFRGQSVQFEAGKLAFPLPKGWQFDRGEITWTTKDGQAYVKVPIIKTEV